MLDENEEGSQDLGSFISFLRWLAGGWSQAKLSKKSGVPRSNISLYENGKKTPRPATMQAITAAVGVPPHLVDFLRWCHALFRKALATGKAPLTDFGVSYDARAAAGDIVERALALARAECALLESAPRQPGRDTRRDESRTSQISDQESA